MNDKRQSKHVVMLVANDVYSDSRVQKVALAASDAGYRVTVIGRAKKGGRSVEPIGAGRIIRVPVSFSRLQEAQRDVQRPSRAMAAALRMEASAIACIKPMQARVGGIDRGSDRTGGARRSLRRSERLVLKGLVKLMQVPVVVGRGAARLADRCDGGGPPDGWLESQKHRAVLADYEQAYLAEVGQMDFDLVHAHDATTIACASNAVAFASRSGVRPALVYDAHEYARGLSNLPASIRDVNVAVEQANIGAADAVVTVSPVLADRLQRDHSLPQTPALVLNAPLAAAFDPDSRLSVRESAGLAEDVPLAVYAGVIKPLRGVATVVRALPLVPDLHVAIVVSTPGSAAVKELLAEAHQGGCAERVHVLPYVQQDQVINYLRTADVGLYPLLRSGNTELAWPTKIFEYLHAGLPMVVSDMPSMSELVMQQGWGEVFAAGDPEGFAAAVRRVLARPCAYETALRDRSARDRFAWEQQARTLVSTYDGLVLDQAMRPQ